MLTNVQIGLRRMRYPTLARSKYRLKVALVISLICAGCADSPFRTQPPVTPQPVTPIVYRQSYQRFVPLGPGIQPNYALDTKTGQICQTWPFEFDKSIREGVDGAVQVKAVLPCVQLYTLYPDDTK